MNRGIGAGLLLVLSVGALRQLGGHEATGQATPGKPGKPVAAAIASPRRLIGSRTHYGDCSAYNPPASLIRKPYPMVPETGAAYSVIDRFLDGALTKHSPEAIQLNVAIAIVPDPLHTELSVMFDRQMVVMQQAAQDERYNYDSSWLPWSVDSRSFTNLGDTQRAEDNTDAREACPGVLLFRKGAAKTPSASAAQDAETAEPFRSGLMVMVVGEQPTGGINQDQWDNAVGWLTELDRVARARPADPRKGATVPFKLPRGLRVLGPTFSGSLDSLSRDLDPRKLKGTPFDKDPVQVLSGSISSLKLVKRFQQTRANVRFGSFQENDDLQIERFLTYWETRGSVRSDVAILSEDETAYGLEEDNAFAGGRPKKRPLLLAYPRDLSNLRAQYQKEAVFSAGAPRGEKQGRSILEDGAEPTDDPSGSTDTISAYSGHVAPLTQEAVLYGIVGELRVHHAPLYPSPLHESFGLPLSDAVSSPRLSGWADRDPRPGHASAS